MQKQYSFSNLSKTMNDLVLSWYLKLSLYASLLLIVTILAHILFLLHPEGCDPGCAPLP